MVFGSLDLTGLFRKSGKLEWPVCQFVILFCLPPTSGRGNRILGTKDSRWPLKQVESLAVRQLMHYRILG
jgi:hypothetical protein